MDWDEEILSLLDIPRAMLPEIRSSSEIYGQAHGAMGGIPVAGDLGDQQAALFGQACYNPGEAKNTYGTGCFMLMNTGEKPVPSKSGLLTTLGYKIGGQKAVYALEGSIAITGALVQWLRDNLGLIEKSADVESLAKTVEDNGGIYFVPAFSGSVRPLLAFRCARGDRGYDALCQPRTHCPCCSRSDGLSDTRGAGCHGKRLRGETHHASRWMAGWCSMNC